MSKFQKWFGGFPCIIDGITTLLICKSFGLHLTYIEWCVRRNYKNRKVDDKNV